MVLLTEEKPKNIFDKKYKTIVRVKHTWLYLEIIDWVNKNSHGSVDVWFDNTCSGVTPEGVTFDIAFEDSDDALIFKIKYSI